MQLNPERFLRRLWSNTQKHRVQASGQQVRSPNPSPVLWGWPPTAGFLGLFLRWQEEAGLRFGPSPPSCHRKGHCHSFLVNSPKPVSSLLYRKLPSSALPPALALGGSRISFSRFNPAGLAPLHPPKLHPIAPKLPPSRILPAQTSLRPSSFPNLAPPPCPYRPAFGLSTLHNPQDTRPGPHRGRHVLRRPPQPRRGAAMPAGRGAPRTASAQKAAP